MIFHFRIPDNVRKTTELINKNYVIKTTKIRILIIIHK